MSDLSDLRIATCLCSLHCQELRFMFLIYGRGIRGLFQLLPGLCMSFLKSLATEWSGKAKRNSRPK